MTVIVEDQTMFREHMVDRVKSLESLPMDTTEVRGFPSYEAIEDIDWRCVSMVIADIHLPGKSGLDLSAVYRKEKPQGKLMFISGDLREYTLWQALSLNPEGFLNKEESGIEDFDRAYTIVCSGGVYLCKTMRLFASEYRKSVFEGILSPREVEVFAVIARGETDRDAAKTLALSEATVTTHRRNIMSKLGLHRSVDLLVEASRLGLRE